MLPRSLVRTNFAIGLGRRGSPASRALSRSPDCFADAHGPVGEAPRQGPALASSLPITCTHEHQPGGPREAAPGDPGDPAAAGAAGRLVLRRQLRRVLPHLSPGRSGRAAAARRRRRRPHHPPRADGPRPAGPPRPGRRRDLAAQPGRARRRAAPADTRRARDPPKASPCTPTGAGWDWAGTRAVAATSRWGSST